MALLGLAAGSFAIKAAGYLVIGDRPLKEWLEEFHAKAVESKP